MDEMSFAVADGKKISHHQFEQRVYEIVPSSHADYHFAEGIVASLSQERRYEDVYEYMKKDGMNI